MPIIQTSRGMLPVQVEFVGKEAEGLKRSVKGSLHLTPGCTKVITQGELDYIEKCNKELFKKLHVVPGVETESTEVLEKEKQKSEPTKTTGNKKKEKEKGKNID